MRGERRAAARAVGNDLEALVKQSLVVNLFERPPFGFDIIVFIGYVRVLHIRPKADGAGEILPHALVFPHAFLAFCDERGDSVFLNLLLAVEPELFFHFQLDRQSVGIPAGLAVDLIAFHRAVARNHVLDDAGEDMSDMRLAVGGRRTVIERIILAVTPVLYAFFKDFVFFPKGFGFLFSFDKIQICRYFFVHEMASSC